MLVNSVYKFSEIYLSYSLNFTTKNNSWLYEMNLAEFQNEPMSLDANKVLGCFDEELNIPNADEKTRKSQDVTE